MACDFSASVTWILSSFQAAEMSEEQISATKLCIGCVRSFSQPDNPESCTLQMMTTPIIQIYLEKCEHLKEEQHGPWA
ncbi:hypothetical protein TcWFU_003423 [Taenia crassiceps]|uniref:Uncharacterized protein n=1 Tax=Taenia crassiceps TaxID=6207 RepID=A0ABR4QHD6_9CEST